MLSRAEWRSQVLYLAQSCTFGTSSVQISMKSGFWHSEVLLPLLLISGPLPQSQACCPNPKVAFYWGRLLLEKYRRSMCLVAAAISSGAYYCSGSEPGKLQQAFYIILCEIPALVCIHNTWKVQVAKTRRRLQVQVAKTRQRIEWSRRNHENYLFPPPPSPINSYPSSGNHILCSWKNLRMHIAQQQNNVPCRVWLCS